MEDIMNWFSCVTTGSRLLVETTIFIWVTGKPEVDQDKSRWYRYGISIFIALHCCV
jgi:hypothetical protein